MKIIRSSLSLKERVDFVNDVVENSKVEGKYEPILFPFAFKAMMLIYFTDFSVEKMAKEDIESAVFSSQAEAAIYPALELKNIKEELFRACREKIEMEREEWLINYKEVVAPDGLGKLADVLSEFSKSLSEKIDAPALVKEIMKERQNDYKMDNTVEIAK